MSTRDGGTGGVLAEIPALRLPRATALFRHRSNRLRELAEGHAAGDWLLALARLCTAQSEAAAEAPATLPPRQVPRLAPLRAAEWPRGEIWRAELALILRRMRTALLPAPAREAILLLEQAAPPALEIMADRILTGRLGANLLAAGPFLAAALQVYFTSLAEQLVEGEVERASRGCPVCASPPVAGAIQGDDKVRFLRCSLCGTDWHLVRVHCATCHSGATLSYAAIDGAPTGTRAEVCAGCRTYVKIVTVEDLPSAEPLADDAASLALDLLLAEDGYARGGLNMLVALPLASEDAS